MVIQEVVKRRKNAGIVEGSTELLPEFTPPEVDPEPGQEFTPFTNSPKRPDLSTDHLNSGARVQQSSPPLGTTELSPPTLKGGEGVHPAQADDKCGYCHTEPAPPGGGICSTCTEILKAAS